MRRWIRLIADGDSRLADFLRAVAFYLATRLALALFVWLTGQHYECHGFRCDDRRFFPHNLLLNGLFQWDAYQYAQLAGRGYYMGFGFDTTLPYFPGFPLSAVIVGKLFASPLIGGIVLNHVGSIVAAYTMARLVRRLQIGEGDTAGIAREATLFWLASPLTLFFCVYLSESLFGLASVTTLWAVAAGAWPLALVGGILATATRNAGLIVVGAAAILAWERRREKNPGALGWACIFGGVLGLGGLISYQHFKLGDGFAWVAAQRRWNRYLVFPWKTFADDWLGLPSLNARSVDRMYRTQEVLAMLLLLPLFFFRKRLKLPWAIWLLGLGEWILPVASHSLISFARYQAGNLYFALAIPALIRDRPLLRGLVWMMFGMVLAWYASTYPFGNWAS
jgi:hypothetical protein